MTTSEFFCAGGVLPADAPSYVVRPADDQLFNSVLDGCFCYVLAPHHTGKSSLMFRTAHRLQQRGVSTTSVDLSGFSADAGVEDPYRLLIKRLKFQLRLPVDPDLWWADRSSRAMADRFIDFLHDVVLPNVDGPIVIFADGVNPTLKPSFLRGFLAAIRSVYDRRATDPTYQRLTFVLLGTATPGDLTKDGDQPPFSTGQEITLGEFSREEARVLQEGLPIPDPDTRQAVFDRILYWTHGHPYFTQKLCVAAAKMGDRYWAADKVDEVVERLFISEEMPGEPNLQSVSDGVRASRRRRQLLALYRRVYTGKEIAEDERSYAQKRLRLLGLVQAHNGILSVPNEIYREAFDLNWVRASMPFNWRRWAIVFITLLILSLVGVAGFAARVQAQRASQAQAFVESFWGATSREQRLASLAGLFSVPGQQDRARDLFYEELGPADRLALFELQDPYSMGTELVTVVKGLYTDPRLIDDPHGEALLVAMAQPLHQLEQSSFPGAINLDLEINLWRKGREYYRGQSEYQRAIEAYDVAISLNDRNPGTYFDRGLAYAAQSEPSQALADFVTVLSLDKNWQSRVQQALTGDPQLYAALWDEPREYRVLVALVPTPTSTPTPTATPSPAPPPTDTPVPPTPTVAPSSTPTAVASSAPTVIPTLTPVPKRTLVAPTPTATPELALNLLAQQITLLQPLSPNETSAGPTEFEWEWDGTLPPGYGFEVRVWREGETPMGVHNALLDSQNGNIKNDGSRYRLSVNIQEAAGVRGRSGVYWWSVGIVQLSPTYVDLGWQADPARLHFEAGTADDGGDNSGGPPTSR